MLSSASAPSTRPCAALSPFLEEAAGSKCGPLSEEVLICVSNGVRFFAILNSDVVVQEKVLMCGQAAEIWRLCQHNVD